MSDKDKKAPGQEGVNTPSPDNEELKVQEKAEAEAKAKEEAEKAEADKKAQSGKKVKFILKHPSVKVDANMSFYMNGEEKLIKLKDGSFETEDSNIYALLMQEGFSDHTVYPVNETSKPASVKAPSKWFFRHPLADEKNKGKYEGATMGLHVNGEEVLIKFNKDGKFIVEDIDTAEVCEKMKFILERTE